MQTTLEIPDEIARAAVAAAAREGRTLDDLVLAALRDRLRKNGNGSHQPTVASSGSEPAWLKFAGAFGKTPEDRAEMDRIQALIDEEFGHPDSPRDR